MNTVLDKISTLLRDYATVTKNNFDNRIRDQGEQKDYWEGWYKGSSDQALILWNLVNDFINDIKQAQTKEMLRQANELSLDGLTEEDFDHYLKYFVMLTEEELRALSHDSKVKIIDHIVSFMKLIPKVPPPPSFANPGWRKITGEPVDD